MKLNFFEFLLYSGHFFYCSHSRREVLAVWCSVIHLICFVAIAAIRFLTQYLHLTVGYFTHFVCLPSANAPSNNVTFLSVIHRKCVQIEDYSVVLPRIFMIRQLIWYFVHFSAKVMYVSAIPATG